MAIQCNNVRKNEGVGTISEAAVDNNKGWGKKPVKPNRTCEGLTHKWAQLIHYNETAALSASKAKQLMLQQSLHRTASERQHEN